MSEEMTARTALRDHQRQIDMDGVEVGVSRQALDEVVQFMGGLAYMTGPPGQPLLAHSAGSRAGQPRPGS